MVAWRSTDVVRASTSPAGRPGPPDQEGDAAEFAVDGGGRLAEQVVLAEVVAVIGAEHHPGRPGQPDVVDRPEQAAEPVVDHRQLGAVVVAEPACPPRVELPTRNGVDEVRGPDLQLGAVPELVVHPGVGQRRVEGLVGVELVDHQEEPVVGRRRVADPTGRGPHGPRTGEVLLAPEPGPGVVVAVVVRRVARPAAPVCPTQVGSGVVRHGSFSWPRSYAQAVKSRVVVLARRSRTGGDGPRPAWW